MIIKNKFDFAHLTNSYKCTIKNIRPFPRIKLKSIQAVQIKTNANHLLKHFFKNMMGICQLELDFSARASPSLVNFFT